MANNYTTSQPTTVEFQGDTVAAGTMPGTYDIVITPNSGFVIQASDFSIGSALPSEVTSVSFSDTATALDPANLVIATVTLAQWYTMPGTAETIEVDIDGATHTPTKQAKVSVTTQDVSSLNMSAVLTVASVASPKTSSVSSTTSGGFTTSIATIDLDINKLSLVGTFTVTADSGYYFDVDPSYRISSDLASDFKIVKTVLTTSSFTNGSNITFATSIKYDIYFNQGQQTLSNKIGNQIYFTITSPKRNSVINRSISKVCYYGYNNNDIIPALDKTYELHVYSNGVATYDVKIEDDNGLSYDFDTNTFTRPLTVLSSNITTNNFYGKKDKFYKNIHNISIPAFFKETAFAKSYKTTVTPTGSTYSSLTSTDQTPYEITLYQFGEVDYTVSVTAQSTTTTTVADTTLKAVTNKVPFSKLSNIKTNSFPENEYYRIAPSTVNNGYFTTSQALTGDNVTGVVGISRQPLITDFKTTVDNEYQSIINQNYFLGIVLSDTTNSNIVQLDLSSINSDVSDLDLLLNTGYLIQGDMIDGYPTIVSISNDGNIVMSSNQTLAAGTELEFSRAGSSIYITELNVTDAGTSSCKLNVSGYIECMGNKNVTTSLILDNFVTSYVAPTAAAFTGQNAFSCPLGSSITISPLSSCTSHSGELIIASITGSEGRGDASAYAKIINAGESIIYTAPSTGTTDTFAYTVNDGINTSSSANIVVNFTA